jgi:heavy metal translocating P-type ATPase
MLPSSARSKQSPALSRRATKEMPPADRVVGTSAILPAAALATITIGALLRVGSPETEWAHWFWIAGLVATGLPVVWRTLRDALSGHFATDVVATLAITASVLMQQPLAGLIVVLMQTGGEALERYAAGRASRAVRMLEEQAPRIAHRIDQDAIVDVDVEEVAVGDTLLVRPGEMIPCDATVIDGHSLVDTSRLTGEPMPRAASSGTMLLSGMVNTDGSLTLRATAPARESQYARIVELVRTAESTKAPLQRVADQYAVWFTPIVLVLCAGTWLATNEPSRVLAILVVATPCPLILATPIAFIGGINRAAARQIIIRSGTALERLDGLDIAVFDKTGTLTIGQPAVSRIDAAPGFDRDTVLRLAASVEQHSGHLLARPVVAAAAQSNLELSVPVDVHEAPGQGVTGTVDGRRITVGSRTYVEGIIGSTLPNRGEASDGLRAYVAIDGAPGGTIEYADIVRPGAQALLARLGTLGIRRTLLLSGDDAANARAIAGKVGIREAIGDLLPAEKVEAIWGLSTSGARVLMVGDGTNDAPALRSAHVGIALAGHGGGISAEAADVVILNDELSRVGDAISIGQRTMQIARQSIWAGLSLSGIAMVLAAAGFIAPVFGAVIQEVIDVAVILNALRASQGPREGREIPGTGAAVA